MRGDDEPLLYRGELTLQGLIRLQLCHIALLSCAALQHALALDNDTKMINLLLLKPLF